jgi:RimJ/RimL family protein N-acetyltransferase
MTTDSIPIREHLIDGFHAALDQVCRERMYFVFLEAPPIEETCAFVRGNMARGRGLGEKLMLQALAAARAFGFGRVELSVRHDNARVLALYRKVGFKIEGRKRHALQVDGVFHDLMIMGLSFDAGTKVSHSAGQAP